MISRMSDEGRVLQAHGLTEAEWAVVFTANYHTPLPRDQIVEMASLEVAGGDVEGAFRRCLERGWIALWEPGHGVVLTDAGLEIKDAVSEDLMTTVFCTQHIGSRGRRTVWA